MERIKNHSIILTITGYCAVLEKHTVSYIFLSGHTYHRKERTEILFMFYMQSFHINVGPCAYVRLVNMINGGWICHVQQVIA